MTAMNVNEYCSYIAQDSSQFVKSRVLVVPGWEDQQRVRAFYKQRTDAVIVLVSAAITTNAFLPMPSAVLLSVKDAIRKVNAGGKLACVIGLDGYIHLLAHDKILETQGGGAGDP